MAQYVDDINATIEEVFDDFEDVAGTPPEIEEEGRHRWRKPDDVVSGLDRVLVVQTSQDGRFDVTFSLGTKGFDPTPSDAIVKGTVVVKGDARVEFNLEVDFDAIAAVTPGFDSTGTLSIRALPYAGGEREIWYDFRGYAEGGEAPEDSITTYWAFGPQDGALEYVGAAADEEVTVFTRWDTTGGRYDHHAQYIEEQLGLIDDIATNCWSASSSEVFDAYAAIDQSLNYYGAIEGNEVDCAFGPVSGHPNPGQDFDSLPAQGEWDDIEFVSSLCVEAVPERGC